MTLLSGVGTVGVGVGEPVSVLVEVEDGVSVGVYVAVIVGDGVIVIVTVDDVLAVGVGVDVTEGLGLFV